MPPEYPDTPLSAGESLVGQNSERTVEEPRPAESRSGVPEVATARAWGVCWLMFASTALNYMDRQTMTLLKEPINAEFHLDNVGFGWLLSAFLLTYAVCQLPAGYFVDRWDVSKTYAGAVAWWSFAGVAAAFSPTLGALIAMRVLLGVGESFNWPCALKATGQVLPPKDRSLGNGIFNSGAAVGAVLTPLIVTPLAHRFGWRVSFIVVGSLGFVWVAVWMRLAGRGVPIASVTRREPASDENGNRNRLSQAARFGFGGVGLSALLIAATAFWFGATSVWWGLAWLMFGFLFAAAALPESALKGVDWTESLGAVVRHRRFWILVIVSVSINVCWHFLVNWLPTYLKEDRNMSFLKGGLWSSVPFLAADVGNLGGGLLSRVLAGRGFAPQRARLAVMGACTLLITSGAWVGVIQNDYVVILLLAVMAMSTAAFMANYFAFTQEVSPRHTGLIVGILGGLGNLCAAGFLPVAGLIKDQTGGFGPVFVIVGLLPFLGLFALAAGWGMSSGVRAISSENHKESA